MADAQTPRLHLILTAAQSVVASHGLRGLTHRAVDRAAGIPEGSTSAYLRTRQALLLALAEHTAAQLMEDSVRLSEAVAATGGDAERAAALTSQVFGNWLGDRDRLLTRLELTVQSARDPELAEVLKSTREHLIQTVSRAMAASGKVHAHDVAETVVATLDGVLLGALLVPVERRASYLGRALDHVFGSLEDDEPDQLS